MILVTGATGRLGGAVVGQLLGRIDAADIAILARDPAKAGDLAGRGVSVRTGDYDDTASLARAMDGVGRVVMVASNQPQRRMRQHQDVIAAAVSAGVSVFGFTSRSLTGIGSSRNQLMRDYFDTEQLIQRSGLRSLIFRNALYLDTLPDYFGGAQVFRGGIRAPAGNSAVAYALRREMGEAIANAIIDGDAQSQTFVLAAPRAYSMTDIAAGLSAAFGKPVEYQDVSEEEFVAGAVARGLPEAVARRTLGFFADMRDGQLNQTGSDLVTLLGREPTGLTEGLREVFALTEPF
jgi:NAD(P)H dehydrogenase (quinone)